MATRYELRLRHRQPIRRYTAAWHFQPRTLKARTARATPRRTGPGKVPLSFYLEKDQVKTLSGASRDVASGIRDADSFGVGSP
jgi:hypothetical protein